MLFYRKRHIYVDRYAAHPIDICVFSAGHSAMVELLLKAGADTKYQNMVFSIIHNHLQKYSKHHQHVSIKTSYIIIFWYQTMVIII